MDLLTNEVAALKDQLNILTARQEEMTKMLAENTVLLQRNLGLFNVTQTMFPIESEDKLNQLEKDLAGSGKTETVSILFHITINIDNISWCCFSYFI